jgi:hypothetical protein
MRAVITAIVIVWKLELWRAGVGGNSNRGELELQLRQTVDPLSPHQVLAWATRERRRVPARNPSSNHLLLCVQLPIQHGSASLVV